MQEVKDIRQFIKDNNIGKIYLDCDGVVMSSCQAIVNMLNQKYDTNYKGEDITDWNFTNCFPNLTEEDVEALFEDSTFFGIVQPINGIINFINEYRDKIIIVTKSACKNLYLKSKWFKKNNISVPIIGLPLNLSKNYINMSSHNSQKSLFIDDSTINLNDSDADFVIQFREYNDDKQRVWQENWDGLILYSWE